MFENSRTSYENEIHKVASLSNKESKNAQDQNRESHCYAK